MKASNGIRIRTWMLLFMAAILLGGCASKGDGSTERLALIKETNPKPMDILDKTDMKKGDDEEVQKLISGIGPIYDTVVLQNGDRILVAYKVKHMHRFRMKKIEKKVNKTLEKNIKGKDFIVSSDYKIFLEAVRLDKLLRENDIPDKKAKKKFDEIVSLKKELT